MWAVINGKIVEASLGQYINPLTSVLLGVIFLKEIKRGSNFCIYTSRNRRLNA